MVVEKLLRNLIFSESKFVCSFFFFCLLLIIQCMKTRPDKPQSQYLRFGSFENLYWTKQDILNKTNGSRSNSTTNNNNNNCNYNDADGNATSSHIRHCGFNRNHSFHLQQHHGKEKSQQELFSIAYTDCNRRHSTMSHRLVMLFTI